MARIVHEQQYESNRVIAVLRSDQSFETHSCDISTQVKLVVG